MNTEQLHQQRLARYVTAPRNEKPDGVPMRPFVAEFTAKYAGYTCQEVTHDYTKAFDAAREAWHLPAVGREGQGTARDNRRSRLDPQGVGRPRRPRQHLHLAVASELLKKRCGCATTSPTRYSPDQDERDHRGRRVCGQSGKVVQLNRSATRLKVPTRPCRVSSGRE